MTMLRPDEDAAWLDRLAQQDGPTVRAELAAVLQTVGDPLHALILVEERMRGLDPASDQHCRLRPVRAGLRDLGDPVFRERLGYGVRPGRHAPLPWPEETPARWRILREWIYETTGWPLGDFSFSSALSDRYPGSGRSVSEWVALVESTRESGAYASLFRDAVSLAPVEEVPELFSLMVQGEGDVHWAVEVARLGEEDPPVHAIARGDRREPWRPQAAMSFLPYGPYLRVTAFARAMLEAYAGRLSPHPSLRADAPFVGVPFSGPPDRRPSVAEIGTDRFELDLDVERRDVALDLIGDFTGGEVDRHTRLDEHMDEEEFEALLEELEDALDLDLSDLRPAAQTVGGLLAACLDRQRRPREGTDGPRG